MLPRMHIKGVLALATLALGCHISLASAWEAQPLAKVAIYPTRTAQAQVVSLNESQVAAEITAPILRLPPEPGQILAKGAVLAQLDCRDYDLAAESAQAALTAAQAQARLAAQQHRRGLELARENFISKDLLDSRVAELDAAQAQVAVQQTALKAARRQVEKCVVRAPFPALVVQRLAQEGEMASPGAPLVRVLDRSRIQVKAEVQAADGASLGQARQWTFVAAGVRHPLRLLRVSPALAGTTRLMEARLTFQGKAPAVGTSGQVSWTSVEPHLPPEVLVRRGSQLGVFIALDNTAPRFMALPAAQEGRPAPAGALPPQARVVVKGAGALP